MYIIYNKKIILKSFSEAEKLPAERYYIHDH